MAIFRSKTFFVSISFIFKVLFIYEMASTVDFAPLRSNEEHEFGKIENNDNVPKGKIISCIQIRKT